tara:strand:+ start:56 stop:1147 length:1092 start_codon:yes stop_codon:yes gene_type:complete
MSLLTKLEINSVRNIEKVELNLDPRLNMIFGVNGSGKTSILESVHLLATGRSFRTPKTESIITDSSPELTIYAETGLQSGIGLSKSRNKKHKLKFDSKLQRNWDLVARALPVQVISAISFLLLEGGPKSRRMFLDWGVFHVKQSFVQDWRATKKCIANRNLLLREQRGDTLQLEAWDAELSLYADRVDEARREYFGAFAAVFQKVYGSIETTASTESISLEYWRGWPEEVSLRETLLAEREKDRRYGSTQNGPHRADLRVKVGKRLASDVLSRGQQKVLICALKIAQGIHHASCSGDECIYLIDDLPAELDEENRAGILNLLIGLGSQLLVTSVDLHSIGACVPNGSEKRTFHVERGTIIHSF